MIDFNTRPEWLRRMMNEAKDSYTVPDGLSTAFDIGLNVGAFSLLNAHKFDKIFAFEPSYDSYHKATAALRAFNIQNVHPYNLAVWDKSGKILHLKQNPRHLASGNASIDPSGEEPVLSISLDDIFELTGLDQVDYVKMDVEGSEYKILTNSNLSRIRWLCMEMHYTGRDKEFIHNTLLSQGFVLNKKHSKERIELWRLK